MRHPVRTIDIATVQDTFLVVAVMTIITIRLQLWITDYPQLSPGRLHIAHLLYGGVFMVTTIILLISFMGRRWRLRGAVLGGIGFGFFIDEVGKFVTKDNDYFFKPTAAIIYCAFLLIYFLTRLMQHHGRFSEREKVMNAIDLFESAASRGFSVRDQERALRLLDETPDHPLAEPLRALIAHTETLPAEPPSWSTRQARALRQRYYTSVEEPWFRRVLVVVFSLWSLVNVLAVLALVLAVGVKLGGAHAGFRDDTVSDLTFMNVASIVSGAVATVFMIAGLVRLRHDRLHAYRLINRALLVTIFITQVFIFAESSFSATTGMVISILLLITVRYMLRQETLRNLGDASSAAPVSAGGPSVAPA